MKLQHVFADSMQRVLMKAPRKLGLAVSGGVDSMALASLAAQWTTGTELHAFVVDHKLRSESTAEANEVARYLFNLGIHAHILTLERRRRLTGHKDYSKTRLEEYARHARRSLFTEACAAEGISHLVLAHHQNDQIELFVQRLLAGSSWFGLAGMSLVSPMSLVNPVDSPPLKLVRPFLQVTKKELRQWCLDTGIMWWEDPSNEDTSLTQRNLIRRLYRDGLEPPAVKAETLIPLLALLRNQRASVQHAADAALDRVNSLGLYEHDAGRGTAKLKITRELTQLPLMVLSELLMRVAALVSPYSEDKIVTRRRKLDKIALGLAESRSRELNYNVMGVHFRSNENDELIMTPEPLRRGQNSFLGSHMAAKTWSKWQLVDNRWFMRWKLRDSHGEDSRWLDFHILDKPILRQASPVMQKHLRAMAQQHRRLLVLKFNNSHTNTTIGLPTLESIEGLDIEVQPKHCSF